MSEKMVGYKSKKVEASKFKSKIPSKGKKAINAAPKMGIYTMIQNRIIAKVQENILENTVYKGPPPEGRKLPLSHYVTGNLYSNTRVVTLKRDIRKRSFAFGFFVPYGLNLEEGGYTSSRRIQDYDIGQLDIPRNYKAWLRKLIKGKNRGRTTGYKILSTVFQNNYKGLFLEISQTYFRNFKKNFRG
jgi:hypothetical protein